MEHIKWVFSGVGVAILSAILAWLLAKRRRAHVAPAPATATLASSTTPPGALGPAAEDSSFLASRIRITNRVVVGDFCEFPIRPDYLLRITLEDVRAVPSDSIVRPDPVLAAEFSVSSRWAYPGRHATETGRNRFLVPTVAGMEEAQCVYGFDCGPNSPFLFRICVQHVNPHARTADLDFVVFRRR